MKYIMICVLLFIAWRAPAQDCNLKSSKDPYTREVRISSGLISLNSAQYSIEATKSEIDFMFSLPDKCFDDVSNAAFFFEGTRLKSNFKNGGTTNCDGLFHVTFRNTDPAPSALQNLSTKKVSSIRFKDNSNKETGVSLTQEQQELFMRLTACIILEAKKLLP